MFNENVKLKYVENIKTNKAQLISIFELAQGTEEKLNKDVAFFSIEEIKNLYKEYGTRSLYNLQNINSLMNSYANWYVENVDNSQTIHFRDIHAADMRECIDTQKLNDSIISRQAILGWCKELPNPREKVILLSLFEGICGANYTEIAHMRIEDIQLIEGQRFITLITGRTIPISSQLYRYMLEAQNERFYSTMSGREGEREYVDLGYIVKYNYNAQLTKNDKLQMGRSIYRFIVKALDYLGVKDVISVRFIQVSGKIQMLKDLMAREGYDKERLIKNPGCKESRALINKVIDQFGIKKMNSNSLIGEYKQFL